MDKLPEVCKDCAEYGSDFCHDCLEELNEKLSPDEKVQFSKVLQNIAKMTHEEVGNTNTKDSE